MTDREIIAAAYDAGVEEEFNRLVSNPVFEAEFELISKLMSAYIPIGATVIDIGAGPGRYAEFLLNRNCKVGLVDLSEKSLQAFNARIPERIKNDVLFSQVACATDLSFIPDNFADAVFLMGPLYHLVNIDERTKAIAEAFRILKHGGYLFSVLLSTFNQHFHSPHDERICRSDFIKSSSWDSVTRVTFQGYQVPQYRCLPQKAISSFEPNGFTTIHIRNLDGQDQPPFETPLQGQITSSSIQKLRSNIGSDFEKPAMPCYADQFLYVGKKDSEKK